MPIFPRKKKGNCCTYIYADLCDGIIGKDCYMLMVIVWFVV